MKLSLLIWDGDCTTIQFTHSRTTTATVFNGSRSFPLQQSRHSGRTSRVWACSCDAFTSRGTTDMPSAPYCWHLLTLNIGRDRHRDPLQVRAAALRLRERSEFEPPEGWYAITGYFVSDNDPKATHHKD